MLTNLGQTLTIPTHQFKNGYSQLWSFGIQQDLGRGLVLDIHYWGNKGTHILNSYNINQLPDQYLALGSALNQQVPNPFLGTIKTGSLSGATISRQQLLLPFPQYLGVSQVYAPYSSATYNALTVQVDKRLSTSLTVLANYTWSKALDDNRTPLDTYNRAVEKSYSSFQVANQAHVSFVYSLPYGRDRHFGRSSPAIVNAVLGDWNFSTITNLQSGLPIGISRPATMAVGRSARLQHPTINQWFDTSVFSTSTQFTFGNVGPYLRDVQTQPIHNVDAVLSKSFVMVPGDHEVTGTLRAEAYNLTNTPQFGFPNTSVTSASFGQVTATLNSPRDLQFAFKIHF